MKIRATKDTTGSINGIDTQKFVKGESYDVPDSLGNDFVNTEFAETITDERYQSDRKNAADRANKAAGRNVPQDGSKPVDERFSQDGSKVVPQDGSKVMDGDTVDHQEGYKEVDGKMVGRSPENKALGKDQYHNKSDKTGKKG